MKIFFFFRIGELHLQQKACKRPPICFRRSNIYWVMIYQHIPPYDIFHKSGYVLLSMIKLYHHIHIHLPDCGGCGAIIAPYGGWHWWLAMVAGFGVCLWWLALVAATRVNLTELFIFIATVSSAPNDMLLLQSVMASILRGRQENLVRTSVMFMLHASQSYRLHPMLPFPVCLLLFARDVSLRC